MKSLWVVVSMLACLGQGYAGEWTVFRGDAGLRGVAEGSLTLPLRLQWRTETGGAVRSTPVIQAGVVYVSSTAGTLTALDLETGRKRWEFKADDALEASPLLVGDWVVVGSMKGTLYAVAASSGAERWRFSARDRIMGAANAAVGVLPEGPVIVFGSYDNHVYGLDTKGRRLWAFEADNFINGAPAIANGLAIFGGCDARLHAVSVSNGTSVVSVDVGSYVAASPAVAGNRAYVGHYGGKLLAVDLLKAEVLWDYGEDGSDPFFASPAVADGRVVAGRRDGSLHAVNAVDGAVVWTFKTGGDVDASPVICDGKVIAGSNDGRLYIVGLADGRGLWSYDIGGAIGSGAAVVDGRVVVGSEDGALYCFGPAEGD